LSIAFSALSVFASTPTATPSGINFPTKSLAFVDGECMPSESLNPSITPFEN
jgi:hypothetical protein